MANDPPINVRTVLINSSVGTSSIFVGPVRPKDAKIPNKAIFITPTGGPQAWRIFGTAHEHRRPTLLIRVRSTDYATGQTMAYNVYNALESADISNYLDCVVTASAPVFSEEDSLGLCHWTVPVQLLYTT